MKKEPNERIFVPDEQRNHTSEQKGTEKKNGNLRTTRGGREEKKKE